MSLHVKRWALVAVMLTFLAEPGVAADNVSLAKDLTNTLSLLGLPCGQVVSVVQQGDKDYIATCQDKNRYRVYVNPQGRVTAQKL